MTTPHHYAWAACGLLGLSLLCGCPGGQDKSQGTAAPPASHPSAPASPSAATPSTPPTDATPATPPTAGQANTPAAPSSPAAAPETPNPQPTGDNWVYTKELHHHVGDKLVVTYKMAAPNPGKAWVGLVPADTQSTDEDANDAVDVSYSYTSDKPGEELMLDAPQAGSFKLRLFSGSGPKDEPGKMLAESPVLTIDQWPQGDLAKKLPPYVTINPTGTTPMQVKLGDEVTATFNLPVGYSKEGWIGVIPVSVKAFNDADNDAQDVAYEYLDGKTNDTFTWKTDKPGTYVFRIFPSSAAAGNYVAESEQFTVAPAGK
jgi:hypothetical protein